MRRFSDGGYDALGNGGYYSNQESSNTGDQSSNNYDFKPTMKLSDTLKLPSISKCRSETNIRFRKKSVGSGKSILKSKSETQLVSILKESSSESEVDRYLSGGYSEVLEEPPVSRPTLTYTKTESKFGTYGFESCRYDPEGASYSYQGSGKATYSNVRSTSMTNSESVIETSTTTSYTRSLDHFTFRVVDTEDDETDSKYLADTLTFPREYKYDHYTLRGDKLVCLVRTDIYGYEEGTPSVISRDAKTHSPDLSIVPQTQPRRPSLFRSSAPPKPAVVESRDSVFKTQTESAIFKSRDLLEKFKFRKPTTLSLAKSLVDEILLFPVRYLLIKQEKLRKYALVHSAVTNCFIHNTGWSPDEKSRVFSQKAEGPFIMRRRRCR
ncbi:hypothetical protein CJU89_3942 [Yarrowia sp. B02]|nr:hypothetical protein CJU89_3942 [Yarrowia sp. B02]